MKEIKKILFIIAPVLIGISLLITGCTTIKENSLPEQKSEAKTYFHKGVYKSYSPDKNSDSYYFYIFNDENSGYTEDNKMGIGLPFSCIQENNRVRFKFAGDTEPEDIFKIKSSEQETVTGSFEDNVLLNFVFIQDANPDNFDAVEYLKNHQ